MSCSPHSSPENVPVFGSCNSEMTVTIDKSYMTVLKTMQLTFADKLFSFTPLVQLVESIYGRENLNSAYSVKHMSIMAWSGPKSTVVVLA